MKARIGRFEVIHSQLLLVPEGAEAWVEFMALDWEVKLKIILDTDDESPDESRFNISGEDDYGVIKLINWDGELGMSFREPVDFGSTNGKKVYFMASGHKIGNIIKLDFQFYMECQDEQ